MPTMIYVETNDGQSVALNFDQVRDMFGEIQTE